MKTTPAKKRSETSPGETLEKMFCKKKSSSYEQRALGTLYEFYLVGDIEEASEYTDWFSVIRSAGENDVIKIYINSPGGELYTAIEFMRVMRESRAYIVASVEGACMSAATLILLCADDFEISPHSLFMVHQYTSGYFGRGNHVRDQLKVEAAWADALFNDIYEGFLTTAEIKAMIEGQDLWFTHTEAIERLGRRLKITAEKAEAADKKSE